MKAIAFVAGMLALLAVACEPNPKDVAQAEVIRAQAQTIQIANDYQAKSNELELQARRVNAEIEADAKRAQIETARTVTLARGNAEVQNITVEGDARAFGVRVLSVTLSLILIALAISGTALSVGWSASKARNAWLTSAYVRIGVEEQTLLPPPFVIVEDAGKRMLLDTRTGARAALRDATGISNLTLAASTQATNTALLTRGAERIAKSSQKNGEPDNAANVLPGIAASVPLIATENQNA